MYDVFFYIFAAITILSAFFVVTTKNVIYAVYSLLLTFFGIAGIYVLLGADFIAIVQIIVYVGGILILMIFGVMLTNKITSVEIKTQTLFVIPTAIGVGIFAGVLIARMITANWRTMPLNIDYSTTVYSIGASLLSDYSVLFILLGILLLIALIGAASIARKED
ncbi:MAG TPA: NADH-quinone oxidoreductase subunit J [Ignavibacteriaceae bacterium]|nr:NADH-quinone oxidoreductase subunit J [Ignavibacteriaceae bacterium]HPO54793.1 NADH-quinone oxidoreductase subunit J [Ignavibacteriaceae bacterium]